jgi:alkanesulfonate monooxygenase SsuD/methylene tetrahydromethanopterin reductase-like flavin-dependent oxidoreductase (luciferase family)
LPLHDPLRIAEDAAVVDLISGGRLRLGVGLGYRLEELDVFGVDRASRAGRLEEGIAVIRQAWADGDSAFSGRWYRHPTVNVTPKPAQRPGPEIWLAGRSPNAVARAARIGDGLLGTSGHDLYHGYVEQLARNGRSGPVNLSTLEFTYPSRDPERDAHRLGEHAVYRSERYNEWYGETGDLAADRARLTRQRAAPIVRPQRFFATVDEVIARLLAHADVGVSAVQWFATLPGAPVDALLPNLELIITDVQPALHEQLQARATA